MTNMVDLNSIKAVNDALEAMTIEEVSDLAEKTLLALYKKLREKECFDCNVRVSGSIEGDFTYLYMISADNMSAGTCEYRNIFRIGG